jgi:hypothetical protein
MTGGRPPPATLPLNRLAASAAHRKSAPGGRTPVPRSARRNPGIRRPASRPRSGPPNVSQVRSPGGTWRWRAWLPGRSSSSIRAVDAPGTGPKPAQAFTWYPARRRRGTTSPRSGHRGACPGHEQAVAGSPATHRYLEQRSITVHVAETREAVEIHNELAEGALVARLFHSTCPCADLPPCHRPGCGQRQKRMLSIVDTAADNQQRLTVRPNGRRPFHRTVGCQGSGAEALGFGWSRRPQPARPKPSLESFHSYESLE